MVRILVVNDNILMREALSLILLRNNNFDVDKTNSYVDVNNAIEEHQTDVVIFSVDDDVVTEKKIKNLKEKYSNIRIILVSSQKGNDKNLISLISYIDAIITPQIEPEELILIVKGVINNLFIVHKSLQHSICKDIGNKLFNKKKIIENSYWGLTKSDIEIIKLIVEGNKTKDIANRLNFSEGTVKNNVSNILAKVDVKDRIQLVVFAIKNDIIYLYDD